MNMETNNFNTPLSEQLQRMKENVDQCLEVVGLKFKHECRKVALNSAERLDSIGFSRNAQDGKLPLPRNAKTLLVEAEVIYQWLIKEI